MQRSLVQTKLPQLRFHPAFQIGCLSAGQWSHWEKQHIQLSHVLGCIVGLKSLISSQSYQKHHQYRLSWLYNTMKHLHKQFMITSYNEHYEHDNLVPLCLVPRAFHCSTPCSIHQSKVGLHHLENRIPWLHSNCASLFPTRRTIVSGFGWLDFDIDDHHDCRRLSIFVIFALRCDIWKLSSNIIQQLYRCEPPSPPLTFA